MMCGASALLIGGLRLLVHVLSVSGVGATRDRAFQSVPLANVDAGIFSQQDAKVTNQFPAYTKV